MAVKIEQKRGTCSRPTALGERNKNLGQVVIFSRVVRPLAWAVLVSGTVVGATAPANAGLFDFLFGGGYQRPAPQQYAPPAYSREPLDVRVNPQRRKATGAAKVRPGKERTKVVNKAIDPRQHPNWYLEDPTLRRGDIVVLPTGAMVYEGGARPQTREDFANLSESRLVSKKERERIKELVGPPTVTAQGESPAAGKEATGPTNPIQ